MRSLRSKAFQAGLAAMMCAVLSARAAEPAPGTQPPGLRVRCSEVLTPDGKPIRLRGFNVLWWVPATAEDATNIQALGANSVRYMFGYQPSGVNFDPKKVKCVEKQIPYFTERGLWVIPTVHMFQRESDKKWPWQDDDLQREFLAMWTYLIERFRDEPRIAAWEPLNEPHADGLDGETLRKWYEQVIAHIRKLDPHRPIVVEGLGYSWPWAFDESLKLKDPNIIYSFHMYAPFEFTHQKKEKPVEYPGKWGREALANVIAPAVRFRDKYNVPIQCGEWGAGTGAPGYDQWLLDVASILEEHGFHWAHWAWAHQPKQPENDSFDVNKAKKGIYDVMLKILADATLPSPRILSTPQRNACTGQRYVYRLDVNGTPLPTISVTNLPTWLAFDDTATISGTPAATHAGSTGEIVVRATSNAGQQEQRFGIKVIKAATGNGTGLRGDYFGTTDLKDLKVTRVDPAVDFAWNGAGPSPSVNRNKFSARWTGQVQAQVTDEYTFYTRTDDGVRLWVNGELLVDQWKDQPSTEHSGRIRLESGAKYAIRMEYLQTGGEAEARLLWSSEETPKQAILTSQLYPAEQR